MKFKGNAKCIPREIDAIFLPYQSKWIVDDSILKLMEKARQIGLSWSSAYKCDERTAAQGARNDQWVSSRDDLQARLFIEDCKMWAKIMDLAAQDLGEVVIDPKDKLTAYVLQFASGKRIHSMSSNPDAQAGKRGSRILDEFALHRDQRKMWAIAYPGITWGGSMELVEASADVLHYRRVGKEQSAEIILNNGPHLIVRTAFGKQTEVNPGGFTILVEDNQPQHVGYFKYY